MVCVGLAGNASAELAGVCDAFHWVGVSRLGRWVGRLRAAGCGQAIMVGRVRKAVMYDPLAVLRFVPDVRTARIWLTRLRHDKRPHAILHAIIDELAASGITLIDSTTFNADQLATPGVMTRRQPTDEQQADARFGWDLCRQISRMDIGQSIAVRHRDVLAVEALEGTNAMIERAGGLCRVGGWTLIKVANKDQDMRADVPSVGLTTIEKLAAAGAGCLVLEVGRTILLEKQRVLDLADRHKIAVVGYAGEGAA